jgi:hypothetical protein
MRIRRLSELNVQARIVTNGFNVPPKGSVGDFGTLAPDIFPPERPDFIKVRADQKGNALLAITISHL